MISEEMKELRKQGIGGSDAGAIMGYDKHKDINKLYLEKLGLWEQELTEEQQDRCDLGNFLEEYVAKKFEEKTGKKVIIDEKHYKSKEYDFIQANIDRRIDGENAILECKTADTFLKKEWKDGEIPAKYIWQCLHYMYVLNVDRVYIACQAGMGGSVVINKIDRNKKTEELIKTLIEEEKEFWNCVQKKIPPVPTEIIVEKKEVIEIPTLKDKIQSYYDIKVLKKDLEKREKALKEDIIKELNGHVLATCGDRRVSYQTQVKNVFDTQKFKKEHENLYKEYLKESSNKILKIK